MINGVIASASCFVSQPLLYQYVLDLIVSKSAYFTLCNYSGLGRGEGALPAKTCCKAVKTCLPCLRKVLI